MQPPRVFRGEQVTCAINGRMEVVRDSPWPRGRSVNSSGRGRLSVIVFGELQAALENTPSAEIAEKVGVSEATVDSWKNALGFTPQLQHEYAPWNGNIGETVHCQVRGKCKVTSVYEGAIRWPLGKVEGQKGRPGLLVFGELARALQNEPIEAIACHWGSSRITMEKYRDILNPRTNGMRENSQKLDSVANSIAPLNVDVAATLRRAATTLAEHARGSVNAQVQAIRNARGCIARARTMLAPVADEDTQA